MAIAKDKFKVGDRVRPSAAGVRANIFNPRKPLPVGEVVGFGTAPHLVRVHNLSHQKCGSGTYAADFWEIDTPPQDVCENDTMQL